MVESALIKRYIDHADVMILGLDGEGKVRLINRKGCEILGASESEIVGQDWFENYVPERLRSAVRSVFQRTVSSALDGVEFFENPVLTTSGSERIVAWRNQVIRDADGNVTEILSTGEDVTVRRQTEAALSESEATLRAILDTVVDGIITIDQDGLILTFNPAAERIFGYRPDEVLGRSVSVLMPDPHRGLHPGYIHQYMTTGQAKIIGRGREVVGRKKDGAVFPLYLAINVVNVQGKKMFAGIVRDLTDFKRLQEENLQSQKLAAIGEMAASVAHEIKNPLAGISGAIEILRDTHPEDDPRREVMLEILEEVKRLDNTVRDLLSFSRPWNPDAQVCSINEIVERVAASFLEQEGAPAVKFSFGNRLNTQVNVDPWLIEKVLWNVLDNAAHAMDVSPEICFTYEDAPGFVTLHVEDNGSGVPLELQQDVFRPFFTTKNRGTGLGLAICKKIMDAHGGAISLFSIPKKGTKVSIRLPSAQLA